MMLTMTDSDGAESAGRSTNVGRALQSEESRRLREIWEQKGANRPSQSEFGELFGIGGQSAVANFLSGRSPLSLKAALGFARGLGVPISAFSPRLEAEAVSIASALTKLETPRLPWGRHLQSTPLLGDLEGRQDGLTEKTLHRSAFDDFTSVEVWTADGLDAYALRVKGDAFYPRYRAGEFLVLSATAEKAQGTDVLVTIAQPDGWVTRLMQWNWHRDGEVQLLPLNSGAPPLTIPEDRLESAERVLGVIARDLVSAAKKHQ